LWQKTSVSYFKNLSPALYSAPEGTAHMTSVKTGRFNISPSVTGNSSFTTSPPLSGYRVVIPMPPALRSTPNPRFTMLLSPPDSIVLSSKLTLCVRLFLLSVLFSDKFFMLRRI